MKDTPEAKKSSPAAKTVKKPRKITQDYLENSGKFYLEKFPASVEHFKLVMTRKIRKSCLAHPEQNLAQCAQLLDAVAEKFVRLGFLDDQALTRGLLTSYRTRGWSQRKIKATLAMKGLSADIIEDYMSDQSESDSSDLTAALRWARKKRMGCFATGEPKPDKWLSSLGRAGFDYGTARRALTMSREEAEDILSAAD